MLVDDLIIVNNISNVVKYNDLSINGLKEYTKLIHNICIKYKLNVIDIREFKSKIEIKNNLRININICYEFLRNKIIEKCKD